MACQVLLEARIKDGCHDELKAKFIELLPETRSREGCIMLHLTKDLDDPSKLVIVESVSYTHLTLPTIYSV